MRIKFDYPKIQLNADALSKLDPQKFIEQEGMNVRARIIADTTAGKKAEGGGLKPYSNSYKDQIDSGSVAGKAPGNHTPNLTATGTLMRSIQTRPIEDGVELFFDGTHPARRKVSKKGAEEKREKAQRMRSAMMLGRLGGHVSNSLSSTQRAERAQKAKSARQQSKLRAAWGMGGTRRLTRADKGKGPAGDVANAVIAKAQYDMGRDGWFEISKKDVQGIMARFKKRMDEVLKNLVARK